MTGQATSGVVDLLVELAAIASPPGGERQVADRVLAVMSGFGLDPFEDDAGPRIGGDTGNILGRLPGTTNGTPIVFCAHLDTVPEPNAIRPVVAGGVVRSDGTSILGADNKAAVATMLEAVRTVLAEDRPHAGIELLFTPMEEIGCTGAKAFDAAALEARLGFVYDHAGPIGVYVSSAPVGYLLDVTFHGIAAHGGIAPEEGRSAVRAAARAISDLRDGHVADGATVNIGLIAGGTAHNIVPDRCTMSVDVRARDDEEARPLIEEILQRCQAAADAVECRVVVDERRKYPGYRLAADDPVVRLAGHALQRVGRPATGVVASGGADASILNAAGVPTINLANGMSRIHSNEEHISVADLEMMVDVTLAIIDGAQNRPA